MANRIEQGTRPRVSPSFSFVPFLFFSLPPVSKEKQKLSKKCWSGSIYIFSSPPFFFFSLSPFFFLPFFFLLWITGRIAVPASIHCARWHQTRRPFPFLFFLLFLPLRSVESWPARLHDEEAGSPFRTCGSREPSDRTGVLALSSLSPFFFLCLGRSLNLFSSRQFIMERFETSFLTMALAD